MTYLAINVIFKLLSFQMDILSFEYDIKIQLTWKKLEILKMGPGPPKATHVLNHLDQSLLKIKNYQFELEKNSQKARTGIYINNEVRYKRMPHLEGVDSHILVIDLVSPGVIKQIINVYSCFNPQNNVNARVKFNYQLNIIKNAMCEGCLLIGDFNLDYSKVFDDNYPHNNLFADFDETLSEFNLIQIVDFVTWSRMIGSSRRTSILDHIYVKNPLNVTKLGFSDPFFGDHVLVEFYINAKMKPSVMSICLQL